MANRAVTDGRSVQRRATGLILAGGESRRMGTDKALLRIDGITLLERLATALDAVCDEVLVASGDGRRLPGPWRQVADERPGGGPLEGLVAGLSAAGSPLAFVVAVDAADPATDVLVELAAHRNEDTWAVVPRVGGRLQPFHAVYATRAAGDLRAALRSGQRSITRLLAEDDGGVLVVDLDDPRIGTSLNTPEDARAAGIDPER